MQDLPGGTTKQIIGYTTPPEKSLPMYLKLKKSPSYSLFLMRDLRCPGWAPGAYTTTAIFIVDYNYYSVPYEYVGRDVEINLTGELLRISCDNKDIAIHKRIKDRGAFSTVDSHYPKYKKIAETEYREVYRAKMAAIGPYSEKLFTLIVDSNRNYWAQPIKGILSLRKKYPSEVLEASCKRAYFYGALSYQIVKNICSSGAYHLPIEEVDHEYAKVQA